MERTQFTFYESFFKAVSRIPKKTYQADIYTAICKLALFGEEPDLDAMPNEAACAMELIIPVIRSGNNKAANRINKTKQKITNENKKEQTDKEKEREKEKENKREYKNDSYKENKKERYGEYNNVRLTTEELEKLKATYPDWQERIERLSSYMASKGDHYKSHYATIRNWANKDGVKNNKAPAVTGTDEIRKLLGRM